MSCKQVIIVGASAAGLAAARVLAGHAAVQVTIITAEAEPVYNKCLLVDWLANRCAPQELSIWDDTLATAQNVQLLAGEWVVELSTTSNTIHTASGKTIPFDELILATGAQPISFPGDAHALKNSCFPFYTYADVQRLKERLSNTVPERIAIVGAGLTGLEAADALAQKGSEVLLIDGAPAVLPTLLTPDIRADLMARMDAAGVQYIPSTRITQIIPVANGCALQRESEEPIFADIVLWAAGARAYQPWIANGGIAFDTSGITVDVHLQTNRPHVWAVGDVASIAYLPTGERRRTTLWADAIQQGMVVGNQLAGIQKTYLGSWSTTHTTCFGQQLFFGGQLAAGKHYSWQTEAGAATVALDAHSKLCGHVVAGDSALAAQLRRALLTTRIVPISVHEAMTMRFAEL